MAEVGYHCPRCSLTWRWYGPAGRRECDNEHVFQLNDDGTLAELVYPDFTAEQIRAAEAEAYRERKTDQLPDRRAALRVLRDEHDADAMWQHTSGVNP
ncbi:hypothetical protein ACFWMR_02210 [Amycolatopsis thailandensis]|uniref:hypothetical protein n=1 Tax=Amycolatopsis thailandensis TaxID=589330 RepID=UPI0036545E11